MSNVRTRAGGQHAPGKRIPPPPSFSPPSLPDTDNLLTVYSRNRSASSSRSVSPVPNITDVDQVTDTQISDEKVVTNKEIKKTVDIRFTTTSTKEQQKDISHQVLDSETPPHGIGTAKSYPRNNENVIQTIDSTKAGKAASIKMGLKNSEVFQKDESKANESIAKIQKLSEEYENSGSLAQLPSKNMEEVKSHQTPEITIEPPSPVIETINDVKSKHENLSKDLSKESNVAQKKVYPKESEAVQTQESSQQSQQNFDGLDREEMKRQEVDILTEKEQTSLYEKFPLQEEKQIKQKLKRRVSKKSSKVKPQNVDSKTDEKELDNETFLKGTKYIDQGEEEAKRNNGLQEKLSFNDSEGHQIQEAKSHRGILEAQTVVQELTTSQAHSNTPTMEESLSAKKETTDISGNKSLETVAENKCQAAFIGQPHVASDPAFTSDRVKVRMQRDKQHESLPEKDSGKLEIHIENVKSDESNLNDGDDIVQEILGSCSHVNKILSRIMDDKLEDDMEEQNESNQLLDDVQRNKEEIVSKSLEEKSIEPVESIADLTVDKVKEYLLIEEQANKILKKELEETKKKKEELELKKNKESQAVPQQKYQKSVVKDSFATSRDKNIVSSNRGADILLKQNPKIEEKKRTSFRSKKEEQMSRIQDFLKDPNSPTTEDVQLDVRLKKTGTVHFVGK